MSAGSDRKGTPPLLVEKLALGELPARQARAVRARLEAEGGADDALLALARSNDAILEALPPAEVAASVRAAARRTLVEVRPRPGIARFLVPALSAAGALALFLVAGDAPIEAPSGVSAPLALDVTREKGLSPHLVVHRSDGARVRALADGDLARRGDVLQLSYVAAGQRYGVVLSIDGGGTVTLHLPTQSAVAARLDDDGAIALPQAYELDGAPAFERFLFVTSDAPFETAIPLEAARRLAMSPATAREAVLSLPAGLSQVGFLLTKPE